MNQDTKKIAGIILAAGEGKRIGGNKALIEINGTSFLEFAVERMMEADCDPIIVVGGSNPDKVKEQANRLEVTFALNKNWRTGQFSSLKTGLASLNQKVVGAMIALVDHPFVKSTTYHKLKRVFLDNVDAILLPAYNGRRGHPIIIPDKIMNEVMAAPDESNLREIISGHKGIISEQPVGDPGILQDIDSKEDLERAGIK